MKTTWETPKEFFDILDNEFHFTLDVCAEPSTAKCDLFFTIEQNALKQDWTGHTFWMNPPYGRGQNVYDWVRKAYQSTRNIGIGVCLLPASTDTRWFHEYAMKATQIRFIKDRLWFSLDGRKQRANHASLVLVFDPTDGLCQEFRTMSNGRVRQ